MPSCDTLGCPLLQGMHRTASRLIPQKGRQQHFARVADGLPSCTPLRPDTVDVKDCLGTNLQDLGLEDEVEDHQDEATEAHMADLFGESDED